jgi:subtilase family serine protease
MLTPIVKFRAGVIAAVIAGLVAAPAAMANPQVQFVAHRFGQPPTTSQCETAIGIACYNAPQFEHAYGTDQLYPNGVTGAGQTIVIVDSFGSPTITQDLSTFDAENGLPDPPSLNIITPSGTPPAYDPTDPTMGGWAIETTLDVEIAHTMAPGANILLVETPVAETTGITGFPQMMSAERYVIDHHMGNVISQSFAAAEQTFARPAQIRALRYAYRDAAAHGVTVLGASGDQGPTSAEPDQVDYYPYNVANWPASDPLVTAVGGTQLHLDDNGNRIAPDNVWNDTYNPLIVGPTPSPAAGGGGISTVFERPWYQDSVAGVVGDMRGEPDISASAAVDGGANLYLGFTNSALGINSPGWYIVGGTSEATPLTAGIVSLADQVAGHGLGLINPALYQMASSGSSGVSDITLGNNAVTFTNSGGSDNGTFTLPGFTAAPGYDLASGLGTPSAPAFVYGLAAEDH